MSTKVAENCPRCGTSTLPTDKVLIYGGHVPCKTWRYDCICGWTWANALQREHNDREYSKMHKAVNGGMYG